MRTIKFRAWVYEHSRFVWSDDAPERFIMNNIGMALVMPIEEDVWYFPKVHITQFTGVKDKNGVEIYEGDILKVSNQGQYREEEPIEGKGEVQYLDGRYGVMGFYFQSLTEKTCSGSEGNWNMEIIGNIYENPELLKN